MAILFRILFTLGLLILHVSVSSGESIEAVSASVVKSVASPLISRSLLALFLVLCVNYDANFHGVAFSS
jgi:hypothetical protein